MLPARNDNHLIDGIYLSRSGSFTKVNRNGSIGTPTASTGYYMSSLNMDAFTAHIWKCIGLQIEKLLKFVDGTTKHTKENVGQPLHCTWTVCILFMFSVVFAISGRHNGHMPLCIFWQRYSIWYVCGLCNIRKCTLHIPCATISICRSRTNWNDKMKLPERVHTKTKRENWIRKNVPNHSMMCMLKEKNSQSGNCIAVKSAKIPRRICACIKCCCFSCKSNGRTWKKSRNDESLW